MTVATAVTGKKNIFGAAIAFIALPLAYRNALSLAECIESLKSLESGSDTCEEYFC